MIIPYEREEIVAAGQSTNLVVGGTRGLGGTLCGLIVEQGSSVLALGRSKPRKSNYAHETKGKINWIPFDLIKADSSYVETHLEEERLIDTIYFCQRYRGCRADSYKRAEHSVMISSTIEIIDYFIRRSNNSADPQITKVVIVSSTYGHRVGKDQDAHYHCMKAAQESLVRYYATRHSENILINGARPSSYRRSDEEERSEIKRSQEKISTDRDIAESLISIANSLTSVNTGNIHNLDNGRSYAYP